MHIVVALKQAGEKAGAYGPFPDGEIAKNWAEENLPEGTWRAAPLTNPLPDREAAPAPGPTPDEPDANAAEAETVYEPPERSPLLKERIRLAHPHAITEEERDIAVSVDFMESPLAAVHDLTKHNSSGYPLPKYRAETAAKYRAWLTERLEAKDERIRSVLNALYQHLKLGHDLILTTRSPLGKHSPAFEIKRRLIDAFAQRCQACPPTGLKPFQILTTEHVWSAELQTIVTDRYGLFTRVTQDPEAPRPYFKPRKYVKQRGPRGKAFFENVLPVKPSEAAPQPPPGEMQAGKAYRVIQQ